MDSNYPIDIHIPKLLDWLISRKICDHNWISEIKTVRDKIRHALGDMPEHEDIARLLSGSYLHYFYATQIVNILKQTEADTKNMFGMYGSNRMKDWQEIIKLYEKKTLYLAESADILLKNIKYEIPNYKKHLHKLENTKSEYRKRIEEYGKTINVTNKDIGMLKKQLGITGDNIKQELKESVATLPIMYENISSLLTQLKPTVTYYIEYSAHVLSTPLSLPLLQYIVERGNTTTYEYKYNKVPSAIEEFVFNIDADLNDDNEAADEGIDWGDDVIDWGDGAGSAGADGSSSSGFKIVVEDESALKTATSDVAKGSDALSILDNPDYRSTLLDDLYELQSFYKINTLENSNSDNTNISITKLESYSESNDKVSNVLSQMNDKKLLYLQNIKHSKSYLNKMLDSIVLKMEHIEKSKLSIEVLEEKIASVEEEIRLFEPKIRMLVDNTVQLRTFVAEDISKRYNGRDVQLIGKIE